MATCNDITGDKIKTKPPSNAYRDGFAKIFNQLKPGSKHAKTYKA